VKAYPLKIVIFIKIVIYSTSIVFIQSFQMRNIDSSYALRQIPDDVGNLGSS